MTKDTVVQKEIHKPTATSAGDFSLVSSFLGYRNKEDQTNLPPGYLVVGSQNVLTTTAGRISVRGGFTRDGQSNTTIAPILASYDWDRHTGDQRNVRAGFLTAAANDGKLQVRYVANAGDKYKTNTFTAGQVFWIDLLTSLTTVNYNFCEYWDSTELKLFLLFVNGTSNVFEWTGGIAVTSAYTINTITKSGTKTWAEEGFYNTVNGTVLINGNTYTYTGGAGTTTLTGVVPDPTGEAIQSVAVQGVKTTANAAITNLPVAFKNYIIENLRNQIYIGSAVNAQVYISKTNNYKDFSFTSPVRIVGEGALVTLDAPPIGFKPQETSMYVSAGKDFWYQTQFTLSLDNVKEDFQIVKLKNAPRLAAKSQSLIGKVGNDAWFVNNEPTLYSLGRIDGVLTTPQVSNISDPIKNDFDSYDFTDGHVKYFRNFVYISVPKSNLIRVWNIEKSWWEAPLILPVSRFAIINGELYGHSYQVGETYKLFSGYNDNGNPIDARALFSYQNFGTRSASKNFNEFYVEGYIAGNTALNLGIQYEIDGCATITSFPISGSNSQIVCLINSDAPLGKVPLGKNPLGGQNNQQSPNALPPKFREIQTMVRQDFFEEQTSFSSNGVDFRWELLAFGPLVTRSTFGDNQIKI